MHQNMECKTASKEYKIQKDKDTWTLKNTLAPLINSWFANALPSPCPDPVIIATFPWWRKWKFLYGSDLILWAPTWSSLLAIFSNTELQKPGIIPPPSFGCLCKNARIQYRSTTNVLPTFNYDIPQIRVNMAWAKSEQNSWRPAKQTALTWRLLWPSLYSCTQVHSSQPVMNCYELIIFSKCIDVANCSYDGSNCNSCLVAKICLLFFEGEKSWGVWRWVRLLWT